MVLQKSSKVVLPEAYVVEVEAVVGDAIRIADELIRVVEEENRRLEIGRPTTIEDLLERKGKLASQFEAFLDRYKAEQNVFLMASETRFVELQAKTHKLSEVLFRNTGNLQKALAANQRRIDTIMRAVREEQTSSSPYSANGRQTNTISFPVSMQSGFKA